MFIKDYDFKNTHATRKQCWTYMPDGNTPVRKGKNLYPLEVITGCNDFKGFYVEVIRHTYGDPSYIIWNGLGKSCVRGGNIHPYFDLENTEQMKEVIFPYKGIDGFRKKLLSLKEHNNWINNAEIMALAENGSEEEARVYQEYHDKLKVEKEEESKKKQEEYERQEQEREQKRQEEIKAQLDQAEHNFREKKALKNDLIEGKSVILWLMDKYGIKIPIKTQGWFNQKLAFVKWIDGEIAYSYYRTKGTNGSQTAFKYLRMLEEVINTGNRIKSTF